MSQHSNSGPQAIGQAVNGFEQLEARQISIHEWRVLSYRNGGITAHEVDIKQLTCDCMDMHENRQDPQVCDHLAVALHHAPRKLDVEQSLSEQMLEQMLQLDEHMRALERRATGIEAEQTAAPAQDGHSGTESEQSSFSGDPVDQMQAELESVGLDHTAFDVRTDDRSGRLEVVLVGNIDDFSAWVDLSDELDMGYDPVDGEDINYIEQQRFSEVFG
jgi:hypothetical protein